jgi:hypothetical protein
MNKISLRIAIAVALISLLGACAALTTLPENKLQKIASAIVNKPMNSVSDVRSIDNMQYFTANATDGTKYDCSLEVVFGVMSQGQKCNQIKK